MKSLANDRYHCWRSPKKKSEQKIPKKNRKKESRKKATTTIPTNNQRLSPFFGQSVMCAFDSQHVKLCSILLCGIFSLFAAAAQLVSSMTMTTTMCVRSVSSYDASYCVLCVCVCLRVVCICCCLRLQDTYFSLTLLFLAIFDRRSRLLIFFFVSVHLFTLLLGHFSLLLFRSPLFFRSSSLVVVFIVFIYLHNELFVAFIAYWDACWASE